MKMVVTGEHRVKGPVRFSAKLPQPLTRQGFYHDIAQLAFSVPAGEPVKTAGPVAVVPASTSEPDGAADLDPKTSLFRSLPGPVPGQAAISRDKIADLSSLLKADGSLEWEVPEGEWILLRVGYTPTGKHNHPARPTGTDLNATR